MARPGIKDVALRAGVSTATVSLVMRSRPGPSERTREQVRAAAAELGYRPDRTASLLARHRSHLIGVVLDVTSSFHAELVLELDRCAADQGLDLVLATVSTVRDEAAAAATLCDNRCEALVLLGSAIPEEGLGELDAECPTVVVGRAWAGDSVSTDEPGAMELAVAHLVEQGYRRIGYLDGGRGPVPTARRRGYRAAMRRHGLAGEAVVERGGNTEEAGLEAGLRVLGDSSMSAGGRPEALVCFNDRAALGVREAAQRLGLAVPGDLALVGIDDSPVARFATIGLTSISQDPAAQAAAALAAVARRLAGEPAMGPRVLPPKLVVRSSSRGVGREPRADSRPW